MSQRDALDRLIEIQEQLNELGGEALSLIKQHFPSKLPAVEAYGVCEFGRSSNPYDSTLQSLIEALEKKLDKEEDEEDEEDE